jgi:hypothetical protein
MKRKSIHVETHWEGTCGLLETFCERFKGIGDPWGNAQIVLETLSAMLTEVETF